MFFFTIEIFRVRIRVFFLRDSRYVLSLFVLLDFSRVSLDRYLRVAEFGISDW